MQLRIEQVLARVCYNGRGDPGIEAEVRVDGHESRALSPSGASRGSHEAVVFAKGGPEATADLVRTYVPRLLGKDPSNIEGFSALLKELDGTRNYSRIGGAAAYSISVASASAAALARRLLLCRLIDPKCTTLPIPLGNVMGGGAHASPKSPSIQEFLVAPVGARSFEEAVELNLKVHEGVGKKLTEMLPYPVGKGDEGAWAPGLRDMEALEVLKKVVDEVSDSSGRQIRMGIDVAADSLYDVRQRKYHYRVSGRSISKEQQIAFIQRLVEHFRLLYVEDPLHEEDFRGFAELTSSLPKTLIVGDDLYATNIRRLRRGLRRRSTKGAILKVNQVGTLGEALAFSREAKKRRQTLIASHRSGDNEDPHLSHFSVGFGCAFIKCGVTGGERTSKLNELIRIGERLGSRLVSFGH